jgi:hypothetical protein
MSNLLYQLAVRKRNNIPLLDQLGHMSTLRIVVDCQTLSSRMAENPTMSPLVSLLFGLKANAFGTLQLIAVWLPAVRRPPPIEGF